MYLYVSVSGVVPVSGDIHGSQKTASGLLELEVQIAVSCLTCVIEREHGSSTTAKEQSHFFSPLRKGSNVFIVKCFTVSCYIKSIKTSQKRKMRKTRKRRRRSEKEGRGKSLPYLGIYSICLHQTQTLITDAKKCMQTGDWYSSHLGGSGRA